MSPPGVVLVHVDTSPTPAPAPLPGPTTLRVLTWNIRDLLGEPLRVRRALRSAHADVVCLQEGPRFAGSRIRLAAFADACGLHLVSGGRSSAGVAMLVSPRTTVDEASAVPLPVRRRGISRSLKTLTPRPRGVVRARVGLPGTVTVGLSSIHLPTDAELRDLHIPQVLTWPDGRALDVVGGDINDVPGSPTWKQLTRDLVDHGAGSHPTFPAHAPTRRIDAVLVDPRLGVTRYGWPTGMTEEDVYKGSDHRPVCADIDLPMARADRADESAQVRRP